MDILKMLMPDLDTDALTNQFNDFIVASKTLAQSCERIEQTCERIECKIELLEDRINDLYARYANPGDETATTDQTQTKELENNADRNRPGFDPPGN